VIPAVLLPTREAEAASPIGGRARADAMDEEVGYADPSSALNSPHISRRRALTIGRELEPALDALRALD
jgi:hypothetical protein